MIDEDRIKMRLLARETDKVCLMILNSEIPQIDIEIAKNKVRDLAEELFPDKLYLFDMIYESRWKRLEEQFRIIKE